jgi:hypothetical protein
MYIGINISSLFTKNSQNGALILMDEIHFNLVVMKHAKVQILHQDGYFHLYPWSLKYGKVITTYLSTFMY